MNKSEYSFAITQFSNISLKFDFSYLLTLIHVMFQKFQIWVA